MTPPALPGIWITEIEDPGPGIRLAVKDLFDTAGIRTTYGSAVFAEHVPARTATAVERLEAAGYANVGKSNLHEFGFGITSQNPHYGTVPNPVAPGHVAGGSSGGSAAALAARLADAALGTDSGGSVRIPAACCDVTGFKPSWDLVPVTGAFPLAPSFDHVGPMARNVAGCAAMMGALAPGFTVPDPAPLDELRIGVTWLEAASPKVARTVGWASTKLPGTTPVELPFPGDVFPAFQREIAEIHSDLLEQYSHLYGTGVCTKIGRAMDVSDQADTTARAARERYREEFDEAMAGLDLALAPTLPIPPPRTDVDELDVRVAMTKFTFPFNAVGAPVLALPCGTADGLPCGLQLIGRPGDDALVLAAGASLERLLAPA